MIKNIVFDIGGVILTWDINDTIECFTNNKEEQEFLYDNVFNSPEWQLKGLIDLGEVSQKEFVKNIQERTKHIHDELVERFILNYYKCFKVNKDVVNLLYKLKELGYKVYVLSNINDYLTEKIKAREFLDRIDGYVLSYKVHQIKPNKEIYKILLDKYNLIPKETIFLDDLENNIETAKTLGIRGILVKKNSYENIKEILKENNILN